MQQCNILCLFALLAIIIIIVLCCQYSGMKSLAPVSLSGAENNPQLSLCGHLAITDTPLIRTAAKSPSENFLNVWLKQSPVITDSLYWGHQLAVPRVSAITGVDCIMMQHFANCFVLFWVCIYIGLDKFNLLLPAPLKINHTFHRLKTSYDLFNVTTLC